MLQHTTTTHVGLDVSKANISVALLRPDGRLDEERHGTGFVEKPKLALLVLQVRRIDEDSAAQQRPVQVGNLDPRVHAQRCIEVAEGLVEQEDLGGSVPQPFAVHAAARRTASASGAGSGAASTAASAAASSAAVWSLVRGASCDHGSRRVNSRRARG